MECFSKPVVYITHNALRDITGGNLLDHIQPNLEPQKALYYLYIYMHTQSLKIWEFWNSSKKG